MIFDEGNCADINVEKAAHRPLASAHLILEFLHYN